MTLLYGHKSRLIIPWTWGNKIQNKMEVDGLSNDQFFFWLRFLDTFCSMGEWVLCVIANWEYRGVVFSCKIGCLHTSTWRSTAYCRYLIAKRQRNFTGNIDVRSSKTALVHTCIGPCPIKNIYMIWYVESGVTRITLRDFTSHPHSITWFTIQQQHSWRTFDKSLLFYK